MEKPLISVIVPICMIENYVGQCIESITEQTYQNIDGRRCGCFLSGIA